ncbi:MAG: hypothetical protein ACYST6_20205, partial [Planctomycetota bacterium]
MNRKLIFLTSLVVLLSCFSAANAGFELKVDIVVSDEGTPVAYTDKSQQPGYEDWIGWARWGTDKETHDAGSISNLGGTGLNVGLGIGDGSSAPGTVLDYTTGADDPICNTWIRSGDEEGGPGSTASDCHLVLYGPGLTPGEYWVYGYHNSVGGSEPNMPRVYVQTYSGAIYEDVVMSNVGAPNDTDGGGVIVEANDANVPVLHFSSDDDLLAGPDSLVKFFTDGSPVKITYEAGEEGTAVLNAFIIQQKGTPKTAWSPFPAVREGYACPDTSLTWKAGEDANKHNVYLDPNLTEEVSIFEDHIKPGDANWAPANWTIYDSNVLHDGNSDGNSHSFSYSFTPGSGSGTLTSVAIDTNEANSMTVELWIKKTPGIEAGDIDLHYWDGSSWDYIADLNSIGPNDVWLHYTDDVNEDEYFISNFKLELRSDISAGELFIDDVLITNTWPILDEWFVGTRDANSYTPPITLDFDTTYYWRVDEVNGPNAWQGFTWHFTTETGKARDPSPGDTQGSLPLTGVSISWTPSCLVNFHNVYLGTDFNDVNTASDPLSGVGVGRYPDTVTTLGLPTLTYATRYYWRV